MAKIRANRKTIIIGASVLAVLILIIVVVKRKKKVAPMTPAPEPVNDNPQQPYVPDPIFQDPVEPPDPPQPPPQKEPAEPDPLKPTSDPVKGKYYAVQKGDTMISVLKAAGFSKGVMNKAYKAMLHHTRNAWIDTTFEFSQDPSNPNELKEGTEILRFLRHFEPMSGKESLSWAWNTKYKGKADPAWKWPCVYVPSDGEVPA